MQNKKLKKLFKDKNVKIMDVAYNCGVTTATVYRWLNGKHSMSGTHLEKLVEYLKCSFYDIISTQK